MSLQSSLWRNLRTLLAIGTLGLTSVSAIADESRLDALKADAETRTEEALEKLQAVRETVTRERVPLGEELRKLERVNREKRSEAQRLQRRLDGASGDFARMEEELGLREDELNFISGMLVDYLNRLNGSIHSSENDLYSDELLRLLNLAEDETADPDYVMSEHQKALDIGMERLSNLIGGHIFSGSAVGPDGSYLSGKFGIIGPSVYFASDNGRVGGLAERGASLAANVFVFDSSATPSIKRLLDEGSGSIPYDTTMGRATALATTQETLFEHIQKGGIWMIPILSFAGVAWLIGMFKAFEIFSVKRLKPGVLLETINLVRSGKKEEADALLETQGGPTATMLKKGVKYHKLPKESLEELMAENILETQPKLERGLAVITVTAAVAPLLGLLGTVTGMINTFKLITLFGTGDARSLSSGISEALITTEFGLIVAIPSLLLSAFLSRKVQGIAGEMENAAITFANGAGLPDEESVAKAS
ncbi:MAG: MotA/TolQ/ExbB proton channel family protein [Opitutales bacterium]|nr:MotA/TolQ/ExbB proton channel family protein [Opitutales bacterium]